MTFVHCGQTVGRIKTKLAMQVGLGTGHIVLDGTQLPLAHVCLSVLSVTLVYCGQTVGPIKTKLGMQVGLVPGHTVLNGE